jgi:hypothetical protein
MTHHYRRRFFLAVLATVHVCALPCPAADEFPFGPTKVHFALQAEGSKLLAAKDDFIQRLSSFDRSARMKVDRPISEEEFLAFVGSNVAEWSKEESQTVRAAFEAVQPFIREIQASFPSTIQIIKTTGKEEGGAAYTRGTAIILPASLLAKGPDDLKRLICHELFHILSRQNAELRGKLYGIIGFEECNEIKLPAAIEGRKITNPDAPRNNHFIRVKLDGAEHLAVPILLSKSDRYDVQRGGEFFEYLQLHLLIVKKGGDSKNLLADATNGSPRLVGLGEVSGFFEQIGRNTEYIIHPEEILAENFALLVLNQPNVASPQILQKMKQLILPEMKK